jgi:hypothetical protein
MVDFALYYSKYQVLTSLTTFSSPEVMVTTPMILQSYNWDKWWSMDDVYELCIIWTWYCVYGHETCTIVFMDMDLYCVYVIQLMWMWWFICECNYMWCLMCESVVYKLKLGVIFNPGKTYFQRPEKTSKISLFGGFSWSPKIIH